MTYMSNKNRLDHSSLKSSNDARSIVLHHNNEQRSDGKLTCDIPLGLLLVEVPLDCFLKMLCRYIGPSKLYILYISINTTHMRFI